MNEQLLTKTIVSIIILIAGIAFTFLRRWKNKNSTAGMAIAGWTLAFLIILWTVSILHSEGVKGW